MSVFCLCSFFPQQLLLLICTYYNSFAQVVEAGWGDIFFRQFPQIHSASSDISSASTNTVDTCTGTGSRLDLITCMTANVKSAQQGLSVWATVILLISYYGAKSD